jgi:hypothetical protein
MNLRRRRQIGLLSVAPIALVAGVLIWNEGRLGFLEALILGGLLVCAFLFPELVFVERAHSNDSHKKRR